MKLQTLINILVLFALVIGVLLFRFFSYDCKKSIEESRKQEWKYHIDSLFIDNHNHAAKTLIVSSKTTHKMKFPVNEYIHLYDFSDIGDSIYKGKGSIEVRLIKRDTIMSFYPECNGEPMK